MRASRPCSVALALLPQLQEIAMAISRFRSRWQATALMLCAVTIALSPTAGSAADEAALNALRQEIADLRARVERLEGELAAGVPVNPARVVQPVEGGWHAPQNWALLTEGMMPDRVIEVLGEADRVRVINKYEYWHYGDGVVRFYLGRLRSWDAP